ncbi:MAG: hypothetical protein GTN40_03140, partial [Candidatus Aenigmarchaeota archaeon]|nr:hypothetical protein [Candidatus Aenigmarchaeota archaeon]
MRSTLDLETLTKSILSILKEEMRLERISLILINQDSKKKTTKKSSENVIASESKQSQKARLEQFPSGSPLLRQAQDRDDSDKLISLIKQKDILVTDELSDPNQDKEF